MNAESFGNIIRKLRIRQGMTQLGLAERLSVSDKTVSKWENGAGFPEITLLPAIAAVFGVSIDYLFRQNSRGIAIAGSMLVDAVNIIDRYPEKNMLANVLETTYAVGGCVPNTIIDLAKIDSELFLSAFGRVGNDEYGRFLIAQMKKYGVDTSGVHTSDTLPTSSSNVMSEEKSGERTFFYVKGANSEFMEKDIDFDSLDCEIFHIGYLLLLDALDQEDAEYGTKMARLLAGLQKRGIKTSIDVISQDTECFAEKVIPALRYCSYVIMNEIECCKVSGLSPRHPDGRIHIENIKKTMEQFFDYGVGEKVVIHCPEAGFLMNPDRSFLIVPSLSLPKGYIKGSVGAGDAYAAACLYGFYRDFSDQKLLEFASCAAACSLSGADSISGMKPKKEIEKLNELYERQELR